MMQEEGRFNRGSEKALSVRRLNREILMRSEAAEEGRRERTRSDDVALRMTRRRECPRGIATRRGCARPRSPEEQGGG